MPEEARRVCKRCLQEKPSSAFWISDKARGHLRSSCKECDKATMRAYYASRADYRKKRKAQSEAWGAAHPERRTVIRRRTDLKAKYGLTEQQFDAMLKDQNGGCALCSSRDNGRTGTKGKWKASYFNVDHDHATSRVRGLLCHKCNVRIGAYEGLLAEVGTQKVVAYLA